MVDEETPIWCLESQILANKCLVVVNLDFFLAFLALGGALGDVEEFLVALRKDGSVLVDKEGTETATRNGKEGIMSGFDDVGIRGFSVEECLTERLQSLG